MFPDNGHSSEGLKLSGMHRNGEQGEQYEKQAKEQKDMVTTDARRSSAVSLLKPIFFFFALNALSVSQRGPAYKHHEKGMIIESVGVRGLA